MYSYKYVYISGMFYNTYIEDIEDIVKDVENDYPYLNFEIRDDRNNVLYAHVENH